MLQAARILLHGNKRDRRHAHVMHDGNGQFQREVQVNKIEETFLFKEKQPIQLTKYNIYTDTLRHGQNLRDKAILLFHLIKEHTFTDLLKQQKKEPINWALS